MRTQILHFHRRLALFSVLCLLVSALQAQMVLSGKITTPEGEPLQGVVVSVSGTANDFTITNPQGQYQIALPAGGAYTVTPHCNVEPLNGVSSYDLVLMSNHVNGTPNLGSPYKIIAADINNTGLIDLADSLECRKLILGILPAFPNNTSWRFVRADYVFPNPQNPFQPPYPESYFTPNLAANVSNIDFIGIKIGDLNSTATTTALTDTNYLAWIDGDVNIDANENCLHDTGEQPLRQWLVRAEGSKGLFYHTTNSSGRFSIAVPPGSYDVSLVPPNSLWAPCTPTVQGVTAVQLAHTEVDFPVKAAIHCTDMSVDLATAFLRRCFNNVYQVSYCNQGTDAATNALVEIEFDPLLEVVNSSIPWSFHSGNQYQFPVGDVLPGDCGSFYVTVLVKCEAVPGQTHCSSAHIYPDTICTPPNPLWSGASLDVSGRCVNGEVVFTITNIGTAMLQPANYVVIEDIMIQKTGGSIQLGSGQQEVVTIPGNGSTWRLELPQVPYHPWSSLPGVSVEGCGTNGAGTFSTGFVTQYPLGDEGGPSDRDCQPNVASLDPNDKQGFPLGVLDAHYLPKQQEITYKIRFQNTGTDTAFNIVVVDTLPQQLDLSTFRPGASSHPYTYHILGPGVVQFIFRDVLLPDSSVNEPLSHGFVQFSIKPRTDLPNEAVIQNEAAIYFDFNAPVITNRTRHTLGEKYLSVSNIHFQPDVDIQVFPNPATEQITFLLKSPRVWTGRLRLSDLQGRLVREAAFESNRFDMKAEGLPAGTYFFRIESEGKWLASGKLLLRE